jgi:O-antigen/teichoic acid export membrane protein
MLLKAVAMLGTNIVLLTHTSLGITAVLIGGIVGNAVFFLCSAPLFFKNINTTFLKPEVAGILKYSIPLIFVGLGGLLLAFGDRYVLSVLQDFGQVGIYTLAYKVASVVNLFVLQAVNLAVLPVALKSFATDEGRLFLKQVLTYLTAVLCLMFLVISFFSMDVLKVFVKSDDYLAADSIIPILLFAYIFDGLRVMYGYHLLYIKKTQWNAYLTIASSVINIGLNFLVIPKYGFMGAAVTTLFSSFITCLAYQKVAQRKVFVAYAHLKIYAIILLSVGCYALYKVLGYHGIGNVFVSIAIIGGYVFVLWKYVAVKK